MSKPWFDHYQEGVPHTINESEYKNIPDILEQSFSKFANNPAFHCMGKTYTFSEINYLSRKFGSYLQNQLGLKKGARVALMMPNILQYPIALFAIMRAGMIAVT